MYIKEKNLFTTLEIGAINIYNFISNDALKNVLVEYLILFIAFF